MRASGSSPWHDRSVAPSPDLRSRVAEDVVREGSSEKVNPASQRAWGLGFTGFLLRKSETGLAGLKKSWRARLLRKSSRVGVGVMEREREG